MSDALESVVFFTHITSGKSVDSHGFEGGHWVAIEHRIKEFVVTIWDSLEGGHYHSVNVPFHNADPQVAKQWAVASFLSTGSQNASEVN